LAKRIVNLEDTTGKFAKASQIAGKHLPVVETDETDVGPNEKVRGYVYLLRSGRKYKIGKSTVPTRRYPTISLLLPEETHQVHTIPTDDPAGIEAYWHTALRQNASTKQSSSR
jgi:hypothetical protein